jgi:hypothetical protein
MSTSVPSPPPPLGRWLLSLGFVLAVVGGLVGLVCFGVLKVRRAANSLTIL